MIELQWPCLSSGSSLGLPRHQAAIGIVAVNTDCLRDLGEAEERQPGENSLDNLLPAQLNDPRQPAEECGAVAQLGARVTGSHEATGSNPVSSTN